MPQFGGETVISKDVKLILMDCFETLVELDDRRYVPRQGIGDFLRHFVRDAKVPVVVVSDAGEDLLKAALAQANLRHLITAIYHAGNASEPLDGGRTRKRLDVPLRDFKVQAADAVFIGDSPLDAQAAQHHGVPFIRVPRSEDAMFSFTTLVTGPSRYRSVDFSNVLEERYRKEPEKEE
ncbi:MAG: HAD family hydrolase [Planctomycetes bacterium]|nr:HAD family hydrolase [Planctomycetota bacterium]